MTQPRTQYSRAGSALPPGTESRPGSHGSGRPCASPSCSISASPRRPQPAAARRGSTGARRARRPSCRYMPLPVTASRNPRQSSTGPSRCTSPDLRALAPAGSGEPAADEVTTPPLIVSMSDTPGQPLPGAREEAENLMRAFPGAAHLTGPDATVEAVLAGMTAHSWFHISAHGTTDERTPVNGGIELADGRADRSASCWNAACPVPASLSCRPAPPTTGPPPSPTRPSPPPPPCALLDASSSSRPSGRSPTTTPRTSPPACTGNWSPPDWTPALHPEGTPRAIREVCLAVRNAYPRSIPNDGSRLLPPVLPLGRRPASPGHPRFVRAGPVARLAVRTCLLRRRGTRTAVPCT